MILESNLPAVIARARQAERCLDVGGAHRPLNVATHALDIRPYERRNLADALDPENAPRVTPETWLVHDACARPWPFPDKFFDFSFCSHLLEDVRDPLSVCAELIRVARAGYIEVPSRAREIFAKARLFRLKALLGQMPEVGFYHHRWFVEIKGSHLSFTAKDQRLLMSAKRFITRHDLGRKMTERESGACLFWRGSFTYEERFAIDEGEMQAFRDRALRELRSNNRPS